jgi:transcriptional regulator with XRE-family HTH domain
MGQNAAFRHRLGDLELTQSELAQRLNTAIETLTGHYGTVSERTIYNMLAGKTRWPQARQRVALEAVFGCTTEELGFHPPSLTPRTALQPEQPVRRRDFITATTGAVAAAAVPALTAPRQIGIGEIQRLNAQFAEIIASDHQHGGRVSIETRAMEMANKALALQDSSNASQRVRCSLYACAAAFTSSAMWAAIDGRRYEAAQKHHERAASLAAMSGDTSIQFRIWSHAGSLYRHLGQPANAVAANEVARSLSITRRDPLFASLANARHAAILGLTGDRAAVQRTIGRAQEALDRVEQDVRRPVWITAFYDQAELDGLAVAAYLSLGDFARAEAHAHRSLALLRPALHRTRMIATARLAHAQLGQGDHDPAIKTAMSISPDEATHPRVAGMLASFSHKLHATAPSSHSSHTWEQFTHDTQRA